MASKSNSSNSDIAIVIKALSLEEYYPEKLTREQIYEITELSLEEKENITQQNIAWHFINRITQLNSTARALKLSASVTKEKSVGYLERKKQTKVDNATDLHPLDIQVAVFLCCDPIAKQELVTFLWDCKLSVPFILHPDKSKYPDLYKWPLRQLITKWQEKGEDTTKEFPIFKYPMKNVGFVRIGLCEDSKSVLINGVIGGSEKAHGPMFFHRHLLGSKKKRSTIVDGLVELGWYFPKGSDTDTFKHCISFANLRGDATKLKQQINLFANAFNVVVVVSNSLHLDNVREPLSRFVTSACNVILVLTDTEMTEDVTERIDELLVVLGEHPQDKFEILIFEDSMMAEKLEQITTLINKMLSNNSVSIEDYCQNDKTCAYGIRVDEHNCSDITFALQRANYILKSIERTPEEQRKGQHLPLQGEPWKRWTEMEMEIHRLDNFRQEDTEQDTTSYRNELNIKKSKCRDEQIVFTQPLSALMQYFICCLDYLDQNRLQIFLRMLKLGLDDLSRNTLRPCYEAYQKILNRKTSACTKENDSLNKELEELDKRKSNVSFGLEHLSRELGQIYEACMHKKGSEYMISMPSLKNNPKLKCNKIPYLATKLLLNGYPIEIMDGDVGFVPETWVKHFLIALRNVLTKKDGIAPTLHVISVLGIQSSGKSTLLNTMFGLQFAVSAGRCTKGVFMQMVTLSGSLKHSFGCDYLIVFDTEGLRSAQLNSTQSVKHDNELSCFAIGLADTTIVNLMGENATYLEENLPIVVHAFLRMDMVGLKPRCTIVHHNVDKRNKDKLMEQTRVLEKVLNDLTKKACDIEGIFPPKQFKEIIRFDITGHTDYIPSLFEGEQPMTAVSIGYSHGCNELRKKLLHNIEKCSRRMEISRFANHLENLWNAIKTNQFVFEFKSTLETEARLHLDEYYCKLYGSLLENVTSIGEKACNTFSKCTKRIELEANLESTTNTMTSEFDAEVTKWRLRLARYTEEPNKHLTCTMRQWTDDTLRQFDIDVNEIRSDLLNQIKKLYETKISASNAPSIQSISSDDIEYLNKLIDSKRAEWQRNPIETGNIAENIWEVWKLYLARRQQTPKAKTPDLLSIAGDAEQILFNIFKRNKNLIDKALSIKPLVKHGVTDFQIDWPHVLMHQRVVQGQTWTCYISVRKELETIKNAIFEKASFELETIQQETRQYSSALVKRILIGTKKITDRNKNKCTDVFVIDISLAVAGYTVTELSKLNDKINELTDIMKSMDVNRGDYIRLINSCIKEKETKIEPISDTIVEKLSKAIILNALTKLPGNNRELPRLKRVPKEKNINMLLYQAVEQNNTKMIEVYRADPESALQKYIKTEINIGVLSSDALRLVELILRTLSYVLEDSPQWLECDRNDIYMWLKNVFKHSNLQFDPQACQSLRMIRDVDVLTLNKHVMKSLSSKSSQICKMLHKRVCEKSDSLTEMIADCFAKLGCSERCPFCNEVCVYSIKNHAWPHRAHFHRPIGSKGFYYTHSKCLSLDTCESLVVSNINVTINEKKIPFRQYQQLFPRWEIRGDPTLKASTFWKWYFVNTYKPDDEIGESEIKLRYPSAWETITVPDVLQQLKIHE